MAIFLPDGRTRSVCIHTTRVVGGVGQHVNAAVDGDLDAGEVGRVGEDQLAVQVALGDCGPGDVYWHRQHLPVLPPMNR